MYSDKEFMLTGDLENYNRVKEAVIDALAREEFFSFEAAQSLKETYAVVLVQNNWFGTMIGRLLGKKDVQYIKIMKIV
jgi:hypothetical protein